jgi:enoyl-CoA hydratase/carnithine racemase
MPESVTSSVRDGVAVVQIDNPPVNALSAGVPEGVASALAKAWSDEAVRAVVLIGAGRTFVAGADIKDLERAAWDPSVAHGARSTCTTSASVSFTIVNVRFASSKIHLSFSKSSDLFPRCTFDHETTCQPPARRLHSSAIN